ncbi:transposase [Gammaproteobacteria bacterium]
MSVPFGPFALTLDDITKKMRDTFETFTDPRTGKNKMYTMVDAALSAFSVFYMQSPSFLEYQRSLEQIHGENNARTLFGAHEIPSDNQIRTLLDATPPSAVTPMFFYLFNALEQAGIVDAQRSVGGALLVAFDGTEYFSSQTIHCDACSTRKHANGKVTYFHSVLTPVLVKPGGDKVIPLVPEFVQPQDGAKKQDCELNAAKRWLATHGKEYAQRNTIILGDDLYCHEPFCQELQGLGLGFILVCKPDSHPTTYEWLEDLQRNGAVRTISRTCWTGKRHEIDTYRYAEAVPLRDADDALMVNWCEITTTTEDGKVLYHNTFATLLTINDRNVAEIVEAGRSRWKIENENNNILKTKGYHFEHNYGHGQEYLSSLLACLIILAFLVHTVLEWMDSKYCLLRQKLSSRRRFFNDIRTLTSYLYFSGWDALMDFMLNSFDAPPSKPETG